MAYQTRRRFAVTCAAAIAALGAMGAGNDNVSARVDLAAETGNLNPNLHCAGFSPAFYTRGIFNYDNYIREMNLSSLRTHDWPLLHKGQRIVDTHFIFPLMKLDPKDPTNYYFDATDKVLELTRNLGVEIFYRFGASIEHTGEAGHFNTLVPEDPAKYAEVCAGIIRHYNKGWANGFKWGIKYWEIWNEPDCQSGLGNRGCWGQNHESPEVLCEKFCKLFVTVLKRLKSEFPEVKIGGPALGWDNAPYFTKLLNACKAEGVAPDFISWHNYGNDVNNIAAQPKRMRKLCDSLGFTKTQLIINEWHYLLSWDGVQANATPEAIDKAVNGPTGIKNIDSAVYNLTTMAKWQKDGVLDQAFYYGCDMKNDWGVLDQYNRPAKVFHSLKMMGDMIKACGKMVKCESSAKNVETLAAWSKDRHCAYILVTDYRGRHKTLTIDVKGAEKVKTVHAKVLDDGCDYESTRVVYDNGRITLTKRDENSAAYLVRLDF